MATIDDNLQNFVSNMGTEADKASHSFFIRLLLTKPLLDAVYTSGGVGGKVVDCVPEDCGRKWRLMTIPDENPSDFLDLERDLQVKEAFVEAVRWARLYGGSVILIEIDGDDPAQELIKDSVSPVKPVSGLIVRDRHDLAITRLDPTTTSAEMYIDVTDNRYWHPSRVLGPFIGAPLPRLLRETNNGWAESILARPYRSLLSEATTAHQITSLLHEAVIDVVGVKGISMFLDGGEKQRQFERRYALTKQLKSVANVMLYDADHEQWETRGVTGSMSGLAPLLEKFANRIASEVDIPMSRLYGKLASGLTTSAETNMEDYHAMVAGYQVTRFTPWLRILDDLLCLSVYGRVPDGLTFEWVPLGEPSSREKAETFKILSEAFGNLIRDGVLVPAHAVEYLASDGMLDISKEYLDYMRRRDGLIGGVPSPRDLPQEDPFAEEPSPEEPSPEEEPPPNEDD